MAKTKLEKAVEQGTTSLNDAQREIVMSQFRDYKRNKARITEIADLLGTKRSTVSSSDARALAAERAVLANEQAALMKANAEISDKLFNQLSDGGE